MFQTTNQKRKMIAIFIEKPLVNIQKAIGNGHLELFYPLNIIYIYIYHSFICVLKPPYNGIMWLKQWNIDHQSDWEW